jgi:tRNA pseudouridine38-40 synthase
VTDQESASRRVALGVEYDGRGLSGWQAQRDPRRSTVQESLESALARVAAQPVSTVCAGRTDAGVHATAQVVHFDCTVRREARAWILGTNSLLPSGIAVRWAHEVPNDFHARFSATARRYRYLILNSPVRRPLLASRACLERRPLDAARMHDAAQALLGERDFSSFRGSGCQSRTPMRRLEEIGVQRHGALVVVDVTANAFLLHMVRNIVGALIRVGAGHAGVEWPGELLAARDRRLGAATAPAEGLYLTDVRYESRWGLPPAPPEPMFEA